MIPPRGKEIQHIGPIQLGVVFVLGIVLPLIGGAYIVGYTIYVVVRLALYGSPL